MFQPIRISHRDIAFEDDNYLAVAKRRGWLVHRSVDARRPNLADALLAFLKHRDPSTEPYAALHHRLDVDTSGVVLFAKTEAGNRALSDVFSKRLARKVYLAICVGTPPEPRGELQHFLKKERRGRIDQMVPVARGGKKAITRYTVQEERGGLSIVHLELVTGRMHQIRAQSAAAGFPVLGDPLYGDAEANRAHGVRGQLLHAQSLSFDDPISGTTITIEAAVPAAFANALGESATVEASPRHIAFHKPFGVLCQFTTTTPDEPCLADFGLPSGVYPVGRLDKDSEGLLLLTSDGRAADRLAHPRHEKAKTYWAQVDGAIDDEALRRLERGVTIRGYTTRPCQARRIDAPKVAERVPPIRVRKNIPTSWIELVITEGKNRQVRRMTAAVGFPTLRLLRVAVGEHHLGELEAGSFREVELL